MQAFQEAVLCPPVLWAVLLHLCCPQAYRSHPCWPRGYSTLVQLQRLYESPCLAAQRPQTFNGSSWVNVSGSGDPVLCRHLISRLFSFPYCAFSRCSFNGTFQPPVAGNFIVRVGNGRGEPEHLQVWGPSVLQFTHAGLLCLLLHRGLPTHSDEPTCGYPDTTGHSCADTLQPDLGRGEQLHQDSLGAEPPGAQYVGTQWLDSCGASPRPVLEPRAQRSERCPKGVGRTGWGVLERAPPHPDLGQVKRMCGRHRGPRAFWEKHTVTLGRAGRDKTSLVPSCPLLVCLCVHVYTLCEGLFVCGVCMCVPMCVPVCVYACCVVPFPRGTDHTFSHSSQLQARVPGQQSRLPDYCAMATFVHQLLSLGYGFDEKTFSGVTFQKKVGACGVGPKG